MPENLALNLGDAGLGASLNALVPLAMRRLSDGGGEPAADAAPTAAPPKTNGGAPPAA
jgi:hypothetical protein